MANLYEAHRQWIRRPPDERYESLEKLLEFTEARKRGSLEKQRQLKEVRLHALENGGLVMDGDLHDSFLTHWSFGQLCSRISAPAGYLRTLAVDLVVQCLNHGMTNADSESKMLIRQFNGKQKDNPANFVSAFTSPNYGRIWDADVVGSLMRAIEGGPWQVPPADGNEPSGLYASDRDMFAFLVSDENPIEVGSARLGRGFFIWNSETGAATFGLTTFLYNYVCANHIVWSAEQIQELRIVHRHQAPDRFYREALPALNRFVGNRVLGDLVKDKVSEAMKIQIGDTLEEVQKWFKEKPFTRKEIGRAWETGVSTGEDVSSLWGMVQGLTNYARQLSHANARVDLERRAGKLLD